MSAFDVEERTNEFAITGGLGRKIQSGMSLISGRIAKFLDNAISEEPKSGEKDEKSGAIKAIPRKFPSFHNLILKRYLSRSDNVILLALQYHPT